MRAFEAAARHVSFVAAAEELNVTAGAISQHIKTLEAWAGTPLFRRNAQGVALTPAGQALTGDFTKAFDGLADATRALRSLKPKLEFHIAALPAIAQLWLPKRLSKIRAHFPQITFSVTAMENAPNLARELFDLALFFCATEGRPDRFVLCRDEIMPVAAPSLLGANDGHMLQDVPLLNDQTWADDWQVWSHNTGIPAPSPQGGPQFSLYSLAVEEAKAGAGALMGHLCLIEDALATGSLVPIQDQSCATGLSLIAQTPDARRRQPVTEQIVNLLKD